MTLMTASIEHYYVRHIFTNIPLIFKQTWQEVNISERKKFENVHNFIKCTLKHIYNMLLQYEIHSPLPSNKTLWEYSQHCTKLHNEVHDCTTCCAINFIENLIFLRFVKQAKNKVSISLCFFCLLSLVSLGILIETPRWGCSEKTTLKFISL